VLIIILMIVVTLGYIIIMDFGWLAYVMTLLWGLQDGALNAHTFQMLGFEFDNPDEAFAVFNLF
jgi:hypothetical protein